MSRDVSFRVSGFKEVAIALEQGAADVTKEEILKIFKEEAVLMELSVEAAAPVEKRGRTITRSTKSGFKYRYEPGNLAKSITMIEGKKGNSQYNPRLYIGPIEGAFEEDDGYYGFFVVHGYGRYGKHPANDFIERGATPWVRPVGRAIRRRVKNEIVNKIKKKL